MGTAGVDLAGARAVGAWLWAGYQATVWGQGEPRTSRPKGALEATGPAPGRAVTSQQKSVRGKGRGWLLASPTPHTSCGLCLGWGQEDNHSYYVSRLYGPSEPRSRELWVDVAKANQSQVKVHRILSNTHRQASVSMPVPGSAALGWEAGGQGIVPGQWAWLWPEVRDPGDAFQGKLGGPGQS